ncbi:hypothetical protein TP70_09445 [Staphylococcus microti]|uniref:Maebl n=1 Tax=Staphylococcus microti TaxID=569857 RepID=A0A0D6XNW4_9STAP|nr:hypothetical protein [Staphylococcus microti]KIX90100.1 hypothetical protein TP70_09445 [Staphylococcus microti]PNZ76965.1 hypothetical protein CD132_11280 [Staphylococcus microti]SUM57764.1 Uncharacterised protein [Staphylococcus microti]
MENKNQAQYTQSADTNNLDFAVSFIAGTLIGSVIGYAVKPFVTRAVNFTQEHELTNVNKHSQKLKQEALRKAEEIKEKAQHIKDEALHKTEVQQGEPTTEALEAQQRAIRSEVDSDKLQVPTKPTYHFTDQKDKPVDLSALKARHDTMTTSDKPKEEVAVSSLAAVRQATAVDKKNEEVKEKAVVDMPKETSKEEVPVSSLAAMRQATAVDKKNEEVKEKAIADKPDEAPKQEVAVSSLAAMRQAMATDKKDGKVVEEKPKVTEKAEQKQQATTVEQRVPQTHREARFENGVITHEKSSQAKQATPKKKATPSKKASQSKPTADRKKTTQSKKTQAKKTPAKKAPAKKSQAKATSQTATKSTKAAEAKSTPAKTTQTKRKASQTQTKAKSTQTKRNASQTQTKNEAKVKKTTNKVEKHTFKSND